MKAPLDVLIAAENGVCMLKTSVTSLSVQPQGNGTILLLAEDGPVTIRYFIDQSLARHLASVLMRCSGQLREGSNA